MEIEFLEKLFKYVTHIQHIYGIFTAHLQHIYSTFTAHLQHITAHVLYCSLNVLLQHMFCYVP